MTGLIDVILERIRANNRRGRDDYHQGSLDGSVDAYEDVLKLLGFYDDEGQPRYKEAS